MEPYDGYYELTEKKKITVGKYQITVGLAWNKGGRILKFIPVAMERTDSDWQIIDIGVEYK
jgi:hypothetical protein